MSTKKLWKDRLKDLGDRWNNIPKSVRKPFVLVVGLLIVIASPFTGVLPGPGGIPVFLLGIAILSTEFEWAKRLRDFALRWVHIGGQAWRRHKIIGTLLIAAVGAIFFSASYFSYQYLKSHV